MPNLLQVDIYLGDVSLTATDLLVFDPTVCLQGVTYDFFFGDPNVSEASGIQVTDMTTPVSLTTLDTNQASQVLSVGSDDP